MMDTNEARDLFSEALEGDLEAERAQAFDAALAADEELKAEYDEFVDMFQVVGDLGRADDGLPPPDLLRGVQERLRNRSKGRYYKDRFAQKANVNWMMSVVLVVTVLLMLGLAWFVTQTFVVMEAHEAPAQVEPGE